MVKKWRSITFILPLALIGVGFFVNSASAEDAVFKAVVDEYLSLELDNTHMEVNVLPNMPFASGYVTATVNTNAAAGYTLTFQDTDSRNGLEREGYDEATDKLPFNIPSVSSDTTYASLAADSWGYYLGSTTDTEATYKQIPLSATEIKTTDAPAADDASRVSFGVKISDTRPSGMYEDTLTFTLVASMLQEEGLFDAAFSAAGKTKDQATGKYKMQDMTSSICDAVTTPTDLDYSDTPETQLVDIRDGKLYWVAKLMDGKCWMTQNLDLDIKAPAANAVPLTSENTDLNTFGSNGYDANNGYSQDANSVITWEPERNTTPASDVSSSGTLSSYWRNVSSDPYSIDTGDWYWTETWYTSTTNNYLIGNTGDRFFQSPTGNDTHRHVGNYYNWTATIASNDSSSYTTSTYSDIAENPQNSICPAGWRLPTISDSSDTEGSTNEFRRLIVLYGNNTSDDKDLTASPLYFVRGGFVQSDGLNGSGFYGNYWSSTVHNVAYSYYLCIGSSSIYPDAKGYGYRGSSVRCVARGAQQ